MKNIINLKLDEKEVLGFNTGLDAQAFAQAKMAQFITQSGRVVFPGGRAEPWNAAGVTENGEGAMVIWGPAFPGINLQELLLETVFQAAHTAAQKDEAFDAIRYWINAKLALDEKNEKAEVFPGAAGALIVLSATEKFPRGTILFPPERIVKRCLEAGEKKLTEASQQWVHPDLEGGEAAAFSAAAMLYTVFCGALPFSLDQTRGEEGAAARDKTKNGGQSPFETLRQDIREGVFLPPELAAPGLDKEAAALITEALGGRKQKDETGKRPSGRTLADFFGAPGARPRESWLRPLSGEEKEKARADLEQYRKAKNRTVKTRRFIVRNTSILLLCAAALVAALLGIRGFIKHRAEMFTTKGLSPVEVVETYYRSFGAFDHIVMEACVADKAGRDDISMVTNLFVITRVRQAYEPAMSAVLSAEEWLAAGSPETEQTVFGVSGLKINVNGGSEESGELKMEAEYTLWIPAGFAGDAGEAPPALEEITEESPPPRPPVPSPIKDTLTLTLDKDAWVISALARERQ